MPHVRTGLAFLALAAVAHGCHAGPAHGAPQYDLALDFDAVAVGALPAGMHVAETNGTGSPGTWAVVDGGPSGSGHCVQLTTANRGDTFNMLLSDAPFVEHVKITVAIRADGGEEDQGGGIVWRAQGPADYYVARWNPLEDNLRIYKVEHGTRTQFQSAKIVVPPGQWHRLEVAMDGDTATVAFDGQPQLSITDATFQTAGAVGLWTKADAATSFDDLRIVALRRPE